MTICSSAFANLGRAQAKALGFEALPLSVVPHPFGSHSREAIRALAAGCLDDILGLTKEGPPQ